MKTCTEADRSRLFAYLSAEPEMNLFILGDVENYGVNSEMVNVYAQEKDGEWDSILLRYLENYIVYSRSTKYDSAGIAAFLKGKTVDCISGKRELLEQLAPWFPQYSVKATYMCRCDHLQSDAAELCVEGVQLRPLGEEEAGEVATLLVETEEFADSYKGPNAVEKSRRANVANLRAGCLCYGVYADGRLVSTAQTSAANSQSAMVVAVATRKEYRGRGYASAAVAALCRASFAQGKRFLCLFYDNPAAGRIYHRLGFVEIGQYAMLR